MLDQTVITLLNASREVTLKKLVWIQLHFQHNKVYCAFKNYTLIERVISVRKLKLLRFKKKTIETHYSLKITISIAKLLITLVPIVN